MVTEASNLPGSGSPGAPETVAGLNLRPETKDDCEFLQRLYGSTRSDEMALTNWNDAETDAFLRLQFDAQHRHYMEHYRQSRFEIIEREGKPIGRLYVARRADDIRIIDIALLPEWRGKGLGGGLMRALLDEAAAAGKTVSIHVEAYNPALRLYERLGFRAIGEDDGIYRLMEWRAGKSAAEIPPE